MLRRGRALPCLAIGAALLAAAGARAAEAPTGAPSAFPPFPPPGDANTVVDWLKANTTVPPETVIAFGPDFIFSLVPGADASGAAGVARRTVREEVVSANFAATMRGRSSVQVLDFDCRKRRFKPIMISVYEGSNLQGKVERLALADEWTDDQPGTYMAEYVKAVCDPGFKFPLAAPGSAPPSAQVVAAAPPPPVPPPTPENPPLRALPAASTKAAAKPVAATAPGPTPRKAALASGIRVQVGAFASDAQAKAAAARLAATDAKAKGLTSETEAVASKGSTLYRALLGGFATRAEAAAFCKTLSAAGRACIVRKAP